MSRVLGQVCLPRNATTAAETLTRWPSKQSMTPTNATPRCTRRVSGRTSNKAMSPPPRAAKPQASASKAARSETSPLSPCFSPVERTSFGNCSSSSGDVSLYARLRPVGEYEKTCAHVLKGSRNIRFECPAAASAVGERGEQQEVIYTCDRAFGPKATQRDVYQHAVSPICEGVLRGYNGAVIAFGQTGSGKTHTIIGSERIGEQGMAPQAVGEIFSVLSSRQGWTVDVTVLEIYNEKVRDLLAPRAGVTVVDIHEVCKGDTGSMTFTCPDATQRRALTPEDALAALNEGMRRRETHRTDMNHSSSRSHLVFTMTVVQCDRDMGATLCGRLHIVDLAGSERLKRSMAAEYNGGVNSSSLSGSWPLRSPRDQRREAGEINKSLSQLALVIQRLTGSGNWPVIPYRDSMLTRLLADSFGGNSKTCLIITCSAQVSDRDETRCSLEFGKRAKLVKNRAQINLEIEQEVTPVMQALIQKELDELQREKADWRRERDMLRKEKVDMEAQLSQCQVFLKQAVQDISEQCRRHIQDVQRLEDEKQAMHSQWVDTLQHVTEAATMERAHLEDVRRTRAMAEAVSGRLAHEWQHVLSTSVMSAHMAAESNGRRHSYIGGSTATESTYCPTVATSNDGNSETCSNTDACSEGPPCVPLKVVPLNSRSTPIAFDADLLLC